MANETYITVRGNAAKDPERRESRNGPWARFSMGVTSRVRGDEGFVDRPTQWFEVRIYGTQAENVVRSVAKGSGVLVRGELRTDTWEVEGQPRSMQYIRADTVALDLHFRVYSPAAPTQRAEPYGGSTAGAASNPVDVDMWGTSQQSATGEAPVPVA